MNHARVLALCLAGALLVGLVAVMLRLAWISDDAFITLRVVENWLAGYGPRWNVDERVQTYTHPLWLFLLTGSRACTGEYFVTTIVVSIALATLAALLLARTAQRGAVAVLALLVASRAFGDFATSGLETPLVMLLLAALAHVDARTPPGGARPFAVATSCALLGLTRLDLLVLAGPVLLANLRGERRVRAVLAAAAGLLPLGAWSAFAALYYGSPFPITAYAKAFDNGVAASELLVQGAFYFEFSLRHDPLTLATIVAGVVVGAAWRDLRARLLALGILLYCVYVLRVGGDFMAGRFFVPPFVVAVAVLARAFARLAPRWSFAATAAALGLAFAPGAPDWLHAPAQDTEPPLAHGIIDERRFYYVNSGLFSPSLDVTEPGHGSRRLRADGRTAPIVMKWDAVGRCAFAAGELFHFVDCWIVDPLLMRLPVWKPGEWRIGHFTRLVPDGYLESLASGEDRLAHPGLRAFYSDLRLVMRAPLWQHERLAALWRLWTGAHADDIARFVADEYHNPPRRAVRQSELPRDARDGEFWFDDPQAMVVGAGGLRIDFDGPVAAATLRISLSPWTKYRLTFLAGERELGSIELPGVVDLGRPPADGGLLSYLRRAIGQHVYDVPVPECARGFDRCFVDCDQLQIFVIAVGAVQPL